MEFSVKIIWNRKYEDNVWENEGEKLVREEEWDGWVSQVPNTAQEIVW